MKTFQYQAHTHDGTPAAGAIEADDKLSALNFLHHRGLKVSAVHPVELKSKSWRSYFTAPSLAWRVEFYGQLATLLSAGVTLDRALRIVASSEADANKRSLVETIMRDVLSGANLASAFASKPETFPRNEIGQASAANQTGTLAKMLDGLSKTLKRRSQLRSKIISALIYPAFLFAMIPISLTIIATVLVPNLAPLFENARTPIPVALRAMIIFSHEVHERCLIWALVALAICGSIYALLQNAGMKRVLERMKRKLPFVGELFGAAERARFCDVLGSLIGGGVPLQTALAFVADASSSESTKSQVIVARQHVVEGVKLAKALKGVAVLNDRFLQMIAIGEETNQLESILRHMTDAEFRNLETRIERLVTLLTPLLTVVMGVLVGGAVMSIMRAILSINDLAGQ